MRKRYNPKYLKPEEMKAEAKRILSGKDCRIGTGENGEHIPLYTFDAAIEAMEEYAQSQLPKEGEEQLEPPPQQPVSEAVLNRLKRIELDTLPQEAKHGIREAMHLIVNECPTVSEEVYVECEPHEAIGNFHSLTMEGLKHDLTPLKRTTLSLPTEEEIENTLKHFSRFSHNGDDNERIFEIAEIGIKEASKIILTLLKEKR